GHVTANDGVKLFFRAWIPQEPKGFLILIHGAGEHSGRYAHIGETCMKENIGIIAPDLRGFGKSGGPRGHVNHFSDYIDDLEILINLFKKRYESAPLFIFGHSLGGLIRSEEHTSELQSRENLVCRLLLEKIKTDLRAEEGEHAVEGECDARQHATGGRRDDRAELGGEAEDDRHDASDVVSRGGGRWREHT